MWTSVSTHIWKVIIYFYFRKRIEKAADVQKLFICDVSTTNGLLIRSSVLQERSVVSILHILRSWIENSKYKCIGYLKSYSDKRTIIFELSHMVVALCQNFTTNGFYTFEYYESEVPYTNILYRIRGKLNSLIFWHSTMLTYTLREMTCKHNIFLSIHRQDYIIAILITIQQIKQFPLNNSL